MKRPILLVALVVVLGGSGTALADAYQTSGVLCRESPNLYTGYATWGNDGVSNTGSAAVTVYCPFVQEFSSDYITQVVVRECTNSTDEQTFYFLYTNWDGEELYFDAQDQSSVACSTVTSTPPGAFAYSGFVSTGLFAPQAGVKAKIISYLVWD